MQVFLAIAKAAADWGLGWLISFLFTGYSLWMGTLGASQPSFYIFYIYILFFLIPPKKIKIINIPSLQITNDLQQKKIKKKSQTRCDCFAIWWLHWMRPEEIKLLISHMTMFSSLPESQKHFFKIKNNNNKFSENYWKISKKTPKLCVTGYIVVRPPSSPPH
jgi:hypothetical protein